MSSHPVGPSPTVSVVSPRSVSFTTFPSLFVSNGTRESRPLDQLIAAFRTPAPRTTPKQALSLWSPGTFRDNHRKSENLEGAWAIGFDVDVKPVPNAAELIAKCSKFAGFFYSSSSHLSVNDDNKEGTARWRVILVLSRSVNAAEYARVWSAVSRGLPFAVGSQSSDPARQWYIPREPENPNVPYVFEELQGVPVDVEATLALEPETEGNDLAELPTEGSTPVGSARIRAAAELLAPAFVHGKRHELSRIIAGACAWSGFSQADALTFLCEVAKRGPEGNEDRPRRLEFVTNAYERASAGERVEGWPKLEEVAGVPAKEAREVLFDRRLSRSLSEKYGAGRQDRAANDVTNDDNPLGVCFGGLDQADEPVEYLVDSIIPRSSVCMFVAEPYTLKTFAALDLAIAVAHGRAWLKKHSTTKGRVVYVNFEMHGGELRRRLRLLKDDGGLVGRVSHPDAMLDDEAFWEALAALKPELVVVDTLSAGNPEVEEKDPRAAAPLRRAARFANETKCSFLFVHHTTKDQSASKKNRVRGTGAIFGALDACYFFEPTGAVGASSSVECIKMRSGPEPAKFFIKLSDERGLELDERSKAVQPLSNAPQDLDKAILLQLGPGAKTAGDIADALNKRDQTVRDRLKKLKEKGQAIDFERRWHLDGADRRKARILEAVERDPNLCTVQAVAKAAHVNPDDVKPLVTQTVIYKPNSDGGFVVKK